MASRCLKICYAFVLATLALHVYSLVSPIWVTGPALFLVFGNVTCWPFSDGCQDDLNVVSEGWFIASQGLELIALGIILISLTLSTVDLCSFKDWGCSYVVGGLMIMAAVNIGAAATIIHVCSLEFLNQLLYDPRTPFFWVNVTSAVLALMTGGGYLGQGCRDVV